MEAMMDSANYQFAPVQFDIWIIPQATCKYQAVSIFASPQQGN
eukprot:CAMPEP_0197061580 /NCGR_PEP_ID=MMETSP1384-20130603/137909_1 /TAXON_ID=29189 /ORGANISM="Ammonia sp." /LENGTH=42 /DNA_ID= /DNA_START= /DNA_END= /DNA_ORIENTATION=